MTLRALLVDDEPLARVALRALLDERDDVVIVGEADSVRTAVEGIDALSPDVVFLDVRMHDGTGFDAVRSSSTECRVICVSAYSEHALTAFEIDAVDYLVKPVDREQLDRALGRVRGRASSFAAAPLVFPRRNSAPSGPLGLSDRVCLQRGRDIVFARIADIVALCSARDYTEVTLASGRVQVIKEPLQAWEAALPDPPFVRIHRSSVVNLRHLEALSMDDDGWHVVLAGSAVRLPVSRRLVGRVKARLE
ncbi:MAG: LytTR family DNA-binding domain-containing protein [Myxococcota bacterium]